MIIALEGIDASGKATQSKLLAEKLRGTRFAFPDYETPAGEAILGHLKKEWIAVRKHWQDAFLYDPKTNTAQRGEFVHRFDDKLNATIFQALQTINRFEKLHEIKAALEKGPVVYDRFTASGLVYGGLDGVDTKWIELINASLPQPDVWIYLDIPIEESFRRRPERRDRYESDRPYLEKVRDGYFKLFTKRGGDWSHKPQWAIVNGVGSVEVVYEEILAIVARTRESQ